MTLKLNFNLDANLNKQDWVEYFNDWLIYLSTDWTITNTGSPTNAVAAGVANGVLGLATGGSSGDATYHNYKIEAFKFVTGKKLYFGARFKLSTVSDMDIVMGLQITDTTPLGVSDGIWFGKDNADALLDAHIAKASTQTNATGIATLADDTYVVAEFYYDGANKIELYVDGAAAGSLALTNAPTTEELCVSFGAKTNSANARTLSIDWIRVMQER